MLDRVGAPTTAAAALFVLANLTACGGDRAAAAVAPAAPPAPVVASVALTPAADSLIAGQRARLALVTLDAHGQPLAPHATRWSVVDSTVARVVDGSMSDATIVAMAPGVARVVATADGVTASATVVVLGRVAAIRVARDTVRLHVGDRVALVATPVDSAGAELPGRRVSWRVVDTSIAAVDAQGVVSARAPRVTVVVASSDDAVAAVPVAIRAPVAEPDSAVPLDVVTYEGSGQVVHPDVVRMPQSWSGARYWMAITPYPNGSEAYEDPSVYASDDGENWRVPFGAVNPLAKSVRGHLSDPALVYDERPARLMLYYREAVSERGRHVRDDVYLVTSDDGVRWTAPVLAYADTARFVVSPSVVRASEGRWLAWAVDAGTDGCRAATTSVVLRTSADGRAWSKPRAAALAQPGYQIWHLDVQWVPSRRQYWAVYAAYPTGATCAATDLFLAASVDGEHWTTYPSPVLARGVVPALQAAVYRSTFAVDVGGDSLTLWFSGARVDPDPRGGEMARWSAAVARTSVAALFRRVGMPPAPRAAASLGRLPAATRADAMP